MIKLASCVRRKRLSSNYGILRKYSVEITECLFEHLFNQSLRLDDDKRKSKKCMPNVYLHLIR